MAKSKEEKKAYLADYYQKNKQKMDARVLSRAKENKEEHLAYWANWRNKNREKCRSYKLNRTPEALAKDKQNKRNWYLKNRKEILAKCVIIQREKRVLKRTNWELFRSKIITSPRHRAKSAFYRVKKLTGVPPWVKYKDLESIYLNCPNGFVVDHIIPVRNKSVCGLHVPWNLQYLSGFDNASKGNKIPCLKNH